MSRLTALLIGNANYSHAEKLNNPPNDAKALAIALSERGFATSVCVDATIEEMDLALQAFTSGIADGDVTLFFFAGHGVQIEGLNYLMGINTPVAVESSAKYMSLPLDKVISEIRAANTSTNILILDACRNNPWANKWRGGGGGLAPVYAPKGTLIAFSTSPGEKSSDGKGKNGAYTSALLEHIGTADLTIEAMFKRVRNTLAAATGGLQTSWEHTSLIGEFFFNLRVTDRITEYGASALKDGIFVPDITIWAQRIARELKTRNWSAQNAALRQIHATEVEKSSLDDLFVLGRNILQAAEGNAHFAQGFITDFMSSTTGMSTDKRKAILDGILFEIFFDTQGELREKPKLEQFNDVFELQIFPDLATSFDFVAAALSPFASRFYSVPGKRMKTAVDVCLIDSPEHAVEKILYAGRDIMRIEDVDYLGAARQYRKYQQSEFEKMLSQQMLVPLNDLTVVYDPPLNGETWVRYPYGYTSRIRLGDVA